LAGGLVKIFGKFSRGLELLGLVIYMAELLQTFLGTEDIWPKGWQKILGTEDPTAGPALPFSKTAI
jgi:hypothetical protein